MWYLVEKLATATRGRTRECLEQAVDANAVRIMGQEIYEAQAQIRQAKQHLASVIADKLRLQRELSQQQQKQQMLEQTIREHLQTGQEQKALQWAETLATHEALLAQTQQHFQQLQDYEQRLLQDLKASSAQLEYYCHALRMAKNTQHAQRAQELMCQQLYGQSHDFSRIQDSLERIQSVQHAKADKLQALEQIDAYIKGTGARESKASIVLERIKADLTIN